MDSSSDADELNDVLKVLSESSTSELVQTTLDDVQTEFASWDINYCRQALTSFTAPATWRSCLHPDLRAPTLASMAAIFDPLLDDPPVVPETRAPPVVATRLVYSSDGTVLETLSTSKLDVVHPSFPVKPHPPYETCSPLHRSVFKGDDSDNMDFIPYVDDHTFDHASHTHHYASFSWQDTFDPDLQVIVFETVYRLHTGYTLTYDEIEGCNVLPLNLYSRPGVSGLLSIFRRRDRLHWPGNTIPASYSFSNPWLKRSDFRNRLTTLNSFFCPNLSCVEPFCSIHVEPNPMPLESPPPSSHILSEATSPCRNQCFIDNKIAADPFWAEADLDIFKVICEISPNATTCVLAELCLKPCHEVYYYRKLIYTDPGEARLSGIKSQRRIPRFNDSNAMQFTPNDPCHHCGPCNNSSGCPCFKNQSHCQRNCHCSSECNRRWKGCHCIRVRSRWSCVTERCPCAEMRRECDPELCVNCRSDDTPCRNSQIQRGARKRLEVKKSNWGLGAFLVEAAEAGDMITEYVGELIYEPTVDSRADLATHRNRCYVFGLNSTFSLDSTYAGNASRFLDHSDTERGGRVNSQAQVRLVNGEHRIGIFAIRDMEASSEVLLNYGSFFFIK